MRRRGLIGLALWFLASVAAAQVDLVREIEPEGRVRVDIAHGKIRIVAGPPGEVRVTGNHGPGVRRVTLGEDAGSLEVRVRLGWRQWLRRELRPRLPRDLRGEPPHFDVDLVVEVPTDTRLFVVSRDAALRIEGLEGPIGVGVVRSSLTVAASPSRFDFESVSGDLDFVGETSRLTATTLGGTLRIEGSGELLQLDTAVGDVELSAAQLRQARITTVSGRIAVEGEVVEGGLVEIETESGEVFVTSQRGSLDLKTTGGSITNEVDERQLQRDALGAQTLLLERQEREGWFRIRTTDGDIAVDSDP